MPDSLASPEPSRARLIRRPRLAPLVGGILLGGLGFAVMALLAQYGLPGSEDAAVGWQALLVGVGIVSQLLIIAGALLSCVAFEERCSCCRALPEEHSLLFPARDYQRLSAAAQAAGPMTLLGMLDARERAEGAECASLEVAVCSGCGRSGRVHVSRRAWCAVRQRLVVAEETAGVERSPWLLQRLTEAAAAGG